MKRESQRGLTLPELLVALFIFSLIATASVYALRLGVEARDQLSEADARLSQIEIARVLIREDMAQLRARSVRDEFGASLGPPFQGGTALLLQPAIAEERLLLAFVRGGWSNPLSQAPRSTLQYVEYIQKNGALVRRIRPYLDDARGQPGFERTLFEHADSFEIAFLAGEVRGQLEWAAGWPVSSGGGFPRAISISFTTDRYGPLTQHFWIGDLAGEQPGAS